MRRTLWIVPAVLLTAAMSSAAEPGAAARDPQARFGTAHERFVAGRGLERLHRNTPASRQAYEEASVGYRQVAERARGTPLGARALYMSGSAALFLDRARDAIALYQKVVDVYPGDSYAGKALLQKAFVEKVTLTADAARRTLEALGGDEKRRAKLLSSLGVIGTRAPRLEALRWWNGEALAPETLRGRVALLYFWATWCPNCRKEVHFMRDLDERYRERGLRIVGITHHTRGQTDAGVEAYLREHRLAFPAARDENGRLSRGLGATSVPTAVLIDRRGVVRWHDHPAALTDAVLSTLLAEGDGAGT